MSLILLFSHVALALSVALLSAWFVHRRHKKDKRFIRSVLMRSLKTADIDVRRARHQIDALHNQLLHAQQRELVVVSHLKRMSPREWADTAFDLARPAVQLTKVDTAG